jgi:hypothetical protein
MEIFEESEIGQIILSLNAVHIPICSQTITKEESKPAFQSTPLIHRHFARLHVNGVDTEKFTSFTIDSACYIISAQTRETKIVFDRKLKWKAQSVFPNPTSDLLLHFSFLGFGGFNPIKHQDVSWPYRVLARHYESGAKKISDTIHIEWYQNSVQTSNDGNFFEALLASCLCIASHSNGLSGAPLKIVLENLAYHLAIKLPDNAEPVALQNYDLLGKFADYIFPVLSAPNAPFPGDLSLCLPTLANFNRTRNIDQIDLVAHSIVEGKTNVPVVSGEAKFRTRNIGSSLILSILKRVPKDSTFHIALVTQLIKNNLSPPDGSFESFCKNTGLQDTFMLWLTR